MAEYLQKQFLDQEGLDALVGQIKAADKVNADAIAAEATRSTEADAKHTADIATNATNIGKVAQDLVTEVATARAAEEANAAAAKAAQDDVDALEAKVGEVPEDKTVVQMIADAKTEATYDDTEVRELIQGNTDAIAAEKERAEGIEGGLNTRLAAVEADYLKAADKTELEGKITAEAERAAAAEKANADDIDALEGRADVVEGKVTTLIGDDAGKSARTIANEELAKQLIAEGAQESLDTLAEIAAWIQQHPEDAAAMNKAIEDLETLVGTLPEGVTATTIVGYIQEVVAAEKSRAEGVESGLDTRLQAVEIAIGEGGSVDAQIDAKIAELDADITSAAVEEGKGLQVQVVEVDGKVTTVAVTGNYDNAYDAKGAAADAQAAAEATAAADATAKANAAQTAAEATAQTKAETEAAAANAAITAIDPDSIAAMFASTEE